MRVLIVGPQPAQALLDALVAEGMEPRPWAADDAQSAAGVAAIVREAEDLIERERPRAVLATDSSDAALMVAVSAVKGGIPTAALEGVADGPLPARIAHLALSATDDPAAIAAAVRGLAGPTLSRP